MKFLNFLGKRKAKKEAMEEELDVPPPPPGGEEDLGLASLGEDFPAPDEDLPEFPSSEDLDAGIKPAYYSKRETPEPKPGYYNKQETTEPSYYSKGEAAEELPAPPMRPMKARPVRSGLDELESGFERRPMELERTVPESPFIRMEHFRDVMDEISLIKNELKEMDNLFISLDDVKSEKDAQFEKWQKVHMDMQRKLIYMDKTLFKKR